MQKKAPALTFHQIVIMALAMLLPGFSGAGAATLTPLSIGQHRFEVELADTPASQETGLMFRQSLAEKRGMLFVFPQSQISAMWMKNTLIPLDMLFIDERGKIVRIAKNAVPHSRDIISSDGPVKAVLELAGGICDKSGIQPGDMVTHAVFAP